MSWIKTLILSQIPLLARFLFEMSSQPDSQGLSDPESDSLSSDSEAEIRNCGSNCSQGPQDRPKPVRCWKFRDFVQAEVSDDSSKLRLIEFIRTRLTHNRPACVRSVTVFDSLPISISICLPYPMKPPRFRLRLLATFRQNRAERLP